jgi:hypothetical protein
VLSVDLDAIEALPIQVDGQGVQYVYDIPTLDDPTRPGNPDAGDPFGGNDGRNQARIVPGGPVQVHAPGFRNPYDVVFTQAGRLYTFDNGPNTGWGGIPIGEGENNSCTNELNENGSTGYGDGLHFITGPGYYGGHPNPTRGNPEDSDLVVYENQGGGWVEVDRYDWEVDFAAAPPVPFGTGDPRQCDYLIPGVENAALAVINSSTNGIAEYTASNFGGVMLGDLLAAAFDGSIYRFQLDAAGDTVVDQESLFSGFGSTPLDVIAQGDGEPFPGTIWVAVFGANSIAVFEPIDFTTCTGADDPLLDEDGDGFDNADEIDNGTNPCSSADVPPDADGDHTSDGNDADDDNDGLPDTSDPFAVDALNGRGSAVPWVLTWDNDAPPPGGLLGMGVTGLMTDGTSDYASLFDATKMTTGGAAGVVTVDEAGDGDALGAANTQHYGFQHGVDVTGTSPAFVVHTRLPAPFSGTTPTGDQSYGVYFGTGTQDDYVKLSVAANGGAGGFSLVREVAGGVNLISAPGPDWPAGGPTVDLFLHVDPAVATVTATYSLDGAPPIQAGPTQPVPTSWFTDAAGPAVGIISTSSGPAPPFPATWDFLKVRYAE